MNPYLRLASLSVDAYTLCMGLGFISGGLLLRRNLNRKSQLEFHAAELTALFAVLGIAGARLLSAFEHLRLVLVHPWYHLVEHPSMAWLGGPLACLAALPIVAKRYKFRALELCDLLAPSAALGYAFGRFGCLLAGDGDYGIPTNIPWAMSFPNGLVPTNEHVHPTPIYEAVVAIAICCFLWRIEAMVHRRGFVFGWYLVLTGVARVLVETIRLNPRIFLGMSSAQLISIAGIIAGIWLLSRRPAAASVAASAH